MRRIVYEPLQKEHLVLTITPTMMEAFFNPPKFYTSKDKEEEYFEFGDAVHEALTSCLFNRENQDEVLAYYAPQIGADKTKRLRSILQLKDQLPQIILAGAKVRIAIEFGRYLVIFVGKFDVLFKREDEYGIAEIKTAAHRLERKDIENRLQLLSYKWLSGLDKIEWWVFTKDGKPPLEIHDDIPIPENVEEYMLSKIKQYLEQKYGYYETTD